VVQERNPVDPEGLIPYFQIFLDEFIKFILQISVDLETEIKSGRSKNDGSTPEKTRISFIYADSTTVNWVSINLILDEY
jgi:hypothetical protein